MRRKVIAFVLILIVGVILLTYYTPSPTTEKMMASYAMANAEKDTGAQNIVTVVYLYYRYYDTLFEALTLMVSIVAVIYISYHGGGSSHE